MIRRLKQLALASVTFAAVSVAAAPASAALVREVFNTDVAGEVAFEATYPNLNYVAGAADNAVSVTGGVATITNPDATNDTSEIVLTPGGVPGLRRVSALVGAGNSNGNYNVGVRIGGNSIVFHPGFGGAALRVDGANGFPNTNVGFTPPNNTLHLLKIDELPGGQFNIRLVDGSNPSNVFTTSFTNAASIDGTIALRRAGPGNATGTGIFDALTVVSERTLFFEGFDLNVANKIQFANAYADFVQNTGAGKTLDVAGGVARLGGDSTNATFVVNGLSAAVQGTLKITADIGATLSNGGYNVGLNIGQNNIVFHPGFAGIPGAFRVDGPGGFGNTSLGFIPANNVLHHLEVIEHSNGLFEITLIDGLNPNNVFKTSFTNLGSVGGGIGFRQEGPLSGQFGLFDNLRVDVVVPEPASISLLLLAGAGLLRRRRIA